MAGVAYFHRFLFPFHSVDTACKYVSEAVAELVCRSPELKVERIEPNISIIIPVYGQLHFVLNCLDSLSRQRSRFSAEIIVADDSSPESSQTWRLQAIPWIRYRLHEPNSGFLDTCNDVARIARGRFLVFLNSDTRAAEGWLDELIDSFTTFPNAGLIGSALFNVMAPRKRRGVFIGVTAALGITAAMMTLITPNIASPDRQIMSPARR